ncbi:hypothetical protein BCR37DRAFT_351406 [Protomyces lactucae-debilis]|uniref:mRNA 3'-end-processing protein n=1 Tax=Protomyces lactucae-debilis TaxID=2754530 RepID=A0A1Y2EYL3_PROLT|nr:uncharacterized protein BCR37DRAFT_351406 [Protomyces lactucae-debilis]ORY76683.1 hypothetical protein BCR37DRAFT_351406 [Protomyces lactucae-debilis]
MAKTGGRPVHIQPDFAHHTFAFDGFLRSQHRFDVAVRRPICLSFRQSGTCPNGPACPDKHINASAHAQQGRLNSVVCKHWLRGLCKKADACEFLHEYNMRHVQECKQWKEQGTCGNAEDCLYAHPAPGSRNGICDWYKLGYCPLGPDCKRKHIRRKPCMRYLTGFCPYGLDCRDAHLQFLVPLKGPAAIPT